MSTFSDGCDTVPTVKNARPFGLDMAQLISLVIGIITTVSLIVGVVLGSNSGSSTQPPAVTSAVTPTTEENPDTGSSPQQEEDLDAVPGESAEDEQLPDVAPEGPEGAGEVPPAVTGDQQSLAWLAELPTRVFDKNAPAYDRGAFGKAWSDDAMDVDLSGNSCDTRNDILARDLNDVVFVPSKRKNKVETCKVKSGWFIDPYTGKRVDFQRGQKTSALVPIDHVVALGDAWYAGAYRWDNQRRLAFANDPINLLATTQSENSSKSAQSAASWMPPNEEFHCEYARKQVQIKHTYDLAVTTAERGALEKALHRC
ncbi:HNH endonuclease family protein [Corynebacterium sp. ES2794-CONJ1]|uniref:HNH endonuclease family protein n=1 Tax=unclassified Corynebacterium TaxID=2624378 RepID=UPI002167A23D|nr:MULTISPECIES: HNH endonuclease family protein [unclassified Corynebacterium]MCS4489784.1 HNH endonuclease family protein [Corynebacterium sp. ES2775-CONJ]MCS4491852.1 HNH endonuclease family protein [Corynebacterium sp. ES2715-CONJ3]MCS4531957.1 HNH endonuclease family protein [Corynebacterium sp. ES2730-CONJ]MCU9519358.1 HNH endonuclease family protein [Corynebacterium sp. ES2794-CONJ1]